MGKRRKTGRNKARRKRSQKTSRRRAPRRGRRFTDVLILSVLALAAYFAIFGGEFSIFTIDRLESMESEHAAQLARTEAEIDSLQAYATRLRDDPAEIERVARERYGMIRDGEILYRFREPDANSKQQSDASEAEKR